MVVGRKELGEKNGLNTEFAEEERRGRGEDGGMAQVVENVEIEWRLRTKDYRPRGQGCARGKAQAVVVVKRSPCN